MQDSMLVLKPCFVVPQVKCSGGEEHRKIST